MSDRSSERVEGMTENNCIQKSCERSALLIKIAELEAQLEDMQQHAKEYFRSLADPTDSLEAMQQKFYALIEVAREYSASSVPAVRSSLCWAWHGIGEWQA